MIDVIEIEDRIAKCERILAADPQSQIFAALADACRKRGDISRAYDICSQGLLLHPDYASARIVMTKIMLAKENYDQAWDELQKAIDPAGRTRSTDLLEAEILIKRGQKSEAAAIIDRLSGSDPDDENIKRLLDLIEKEVTTTVSVEPVPSAVADHGSPKSEQIAIKIEKKGIPLSQAMGLLKITPRVLGVMGVGNEGLILEARFDSNYPKEEFAALSKSMYDGVAQGIIKIGLGTSSEILIETSSSKLWVLKKEKFYLVIYTRDDVSMGALKLKIDELFGNVEL
jgi:predicted regulator of Ras-like GTPase activity (Roadblock/LC7/MglB family)